MSLLRSSVLIRAGIASAVLCALVGSTARAQVPPWRDQSLTFEQRTADLVARMTLEEKVSQMKDVAPGIERLGIPAYNWWNEGLHGVARSGLATVFPQAIGLAATWNDSLMFRVATTISDEARAKHHDYARKGARERYQGLTYWSPNINIFRDPRWGRGQETYGEDPFLTGRLGVQFVRGLQGDDPMYFKTIATVKHYAVHSGPEPERHEFDAVTSERDLRETYLPHFEAGIRAGAYSIMCAYNRLYGKVACGSEMLLDTVLRGEWGFKGYVVSDCGAIDDIYLRHRVTQTAAQASALAVRRGTDLECGRVYTSLVDAVKQGLITEAEVDVAVRRLFLARMKLGMFDDSSRVRWAGTPISLVDAPAHRVLARRTARESMVLLRNQGGLLPLRKDLRSVAVIGPNADQWRMLLGNYNGFPSDPVTPLRGIRAAVSRTTRVRYARGSDLADNFPVLDVVPRSALSTPRGTRGLHAEYFKGPAIQGAPLFSRTDSTIDVDWKDGAPRTDMDPNSFAVRWTGTLRPTHTGAYHLGLTGTMRMRVFVNDSLVAQSTYPQRNGEYPDARTVRSDALTLEAGRGYRLRVEGEESYGSADLQLTWSSPGEALQAEAIAAARQADVVVMVLGLTANLEGEEMRVQVDGFRGGDRTSIDLPAAQQRLLERITALGKPVVLVLMSGSAVAVPWAQEHVPAIVQAWYPGQAGDAIADVLFGDHNPAGRLPVTFYRSTEDLPPFEDYNMAGRTYRFFDGPVLYPFGHGLSYTTFAYDSLHLSTGDLRASDTLTVRVNLTNTGKRSGDEVAQLYLQHIGSTVSRPRLDLRGYSRVTLAPGQTRTVVFSVPSASLAYWNSTQRRWVLESDRVRVMVGASSADIRASGIVRVTGER